MNVELVPFHAPLAYFQSPYYGVFNLNSVVYAAKSG